MRGKNAKNRRTAPQKMLGEARHDVLFRRRLHGNCALMEFRGSVIDAYP